MHLIDAMDQAVSNPYFICHWDENQLFIAFAIAPNNENAGGIFKAQFSLYIQCLLNTPMLYHQAPVVKKLRNQETLTYFMYELLVNHTFNDIIQRMLIHLILLFM